MTLLNEKHKLQPEHDGCRQSCTDSCRSLSVGYGSVPLNIKWRISTGGASRKLFGDFWTPNGSQETLGNDPDSYGCSDSQSLPCMVIDLIWSICGVVIIVITICLLVAVIIVNVMSGTLVIIIIIIA